MILNINGACDVLAFVCTCTCGAKKTIGWYIILARVGCMACVTYKCVAKRMGPRALQLECLVRCMTAPVLHSPLVKFVEKRETRLDSMRGS